jgi:hypothetical protein
MAFKSPRTGGKPFMVTQQNGTQKITSAKRPVDLTVRNDLTKKQTTTP